MVPMTGPFVRQKIENWAADFLHGDRARAFAGPIVEYAEEILVRLLDSACAVRGVEPEDVGEADLRAALLRDVAAIGVPPDAREMVPALCAVFLEDLEAQGRLGGGRRLGLFVRALRQPWSAASGAPRRPERRVAPKISPNDPCPCGSGRKFKHCCR